MIQYFFHSICIVYPMLLTTMPLINRPNYLGYTPSPFSFRRFFFIPIKKHHFCFYPYSIKNGNLYEPFLFLFSLSNSNINVEVNILINLK